MKKVIFNHKSLNIVFADGVKDKLFSYRQRKKSDIETGGVLMGELYLKSNKIKITHVLACKDNIASRYRIDLNIKCLQNQINKIWEESGGTVTYLGDWHTHPEINPSPSFMDYKTFVLNYYTSKFNHNCLLYLILGVKKNIWLKSFDGFLFFGKNFKE